MHGEWPDAIDAAQRASSGCPDRRSRRSARRSTSWPSCTGCAASSPRPSRRTARPASGVASRSRGWPCCGWRRARSTPPRRRSAGRWTRRTIGCSRARLLAAFVEILLAAGDVPAARAAADELSRIAADVGAPLLRAVAAQATGTVLLAEGDARAALAALRRAWTAWQEFDAPYEAARVRVLVGLACRRARRRGQRAQMELDAARWVFRQLGAAPDLAGLEALSAGRRPARAG